jgi:1,4-dihydroxy-2-naphthoate polyprenyltransferase
MSPWILATRPKTFVAGIIPVAVGSALAFQAGSFHWATAVAALLGALCIQIGTNFVNDAADFEKGADTEERLGPPRMAALGLLSPKDLYRGAGAVFLLAAVFGAYLTYAAGPVILGIGLFSILFAIAYTAGPFPLAYLGLGDLFVLIFFGLVAVLGTYFAHTGGITKAAIYLSFAVGFLGVSLIAVNNLRDIPTDVKAGKRTLAVRMGDFNARWYYGALLFLPFLFWLPFFFQLNTLPAVLPFLSLPLARANASACLRIKDRRQFNPLLARTAAFQLVFGILVCASLVLSR